MGSRVALRARSAQLPAEFSCSTRPSHAASDPRDPRGGVRREPAAAADEEAPLRRPAGPSHAAASKDRSLRCFLVEDSPVIRQNLISTLEEMLPLEVVASAEDEQEAVQWMRRADVHCDLMIIDIFLKAGTGLEVLRKARLLRPEAKLVVLSNYATADMRQALPRPGGRSDLRQVRGGRRVA